MAIAISYGQNCSTLQIISTTGVSVCGHGSAILSASASGTGNAIFWYDAPMDGGQFGRRWLNLSYSSNFNDNILLGHGNIR